MQRLSVGWGGGEVFKYDDSAAEKKLLSFSLLKRATSIANKLTNTFNRLTSSSTPSITINYYQDLTHLNQFQFPIQLFKKVCILN